MDHVGVNAAISVGTTLLMDPWFEIIIFHHIIMGRLNQLATDCAIALCTCVMVNMKFSASRNPKG